MTIQAGLWSLLRWATMTLLIMAGSLAQPTGLATYLREQTPVEAAALNPVRNSQPAAGASNRSLVALQSWTGADIGAPSTPGSGIPAGSAFTLRGAGVGINTGSNDQGYFVSTPRSGDVEIVVKVLQVTGGAKTQVGIMLRETVNANADMACALYEVPTPPSVSPVLRQAYRRPGYTINNTNTAPISTPGWLKLQRVGQSYSTSRSTDGLIWVPISNYAGGGFTPANYLAGFFISGGGAAAVAEAQLELVYLGPPQLEYRTTWVGNTFSNDVDRYVSHTLNALYVGADGRCFTHSTYDEANEPAKIYQDGKVIKRIEAPLGCNGHCVANGSITGDGQFVYLLGRPVTDAATGKMLDKPYRTDLNGQNAVGITLSTKTEVLGGMAAGNGEIYFSDTTNQQILVASATTLTELPARKFPFTRPGPMTLDHQGNLWIIQRATDHPISLQPQYPAAIRCYRPDGTFTGKEITDVVNPTAVALDPTQARLIVAEVGPAQNIRFYGLGGSTPVFSGTFGVPGGIFNEPNPGAINDSANGGYQRLYGPVGVGMDAQRNLYVACQDGAGGTDLRKYDVNGNLAWQLVGLVYVSVPDFDPATDGRDLFSYREHFSMDYSRTAPGSEWSFTGVTRNLLAPPAQAAPTGANTLIRRLGPNNERIMFTIGAPPFGINIYRFKGELAVPCGAYSKVVENGETVERMWVDLNGDGLESADERYIPDYYDRIHQWSALEVDAQGNLLIKDAAHNFYQEQAGVKMIRRFPFQGLSAQGVPLYQLGRTGYEDIQVPFEIAYPFHFRYITTDDAMYFVGFTHDQKHVLARYDHWSTPQRILRYLRPLPTPRDSTSFFFFPPYSQTPDFQKLDPSSPDSEFHYFALDVAGDKVFIGELWGPIHVYDAKLGNPITRLLPGPEVSGAAGWTDIRQGIRAFRRSTGEYLVTREDAGIRARNLLFRWTPATLGRAPQSPTELSAVGGVNKIQLRWTGSLGLIRQYEVWRGTASGGETLYAANVLTPLFDDTGVTPGVTYYYKVRAVNEAGASDFSNEAPTLANAAAKFVKVDALTEGNWKGSYGTEGYSVVGDAQSLPNSIQLRADSYYPGQRVINPTNSPYFPPNVRNNGVTTNQEYLEKASSTEHHDAFWASPRVTMDWYFSDGAAHQLALYLRPTPGVNSYCKIDLYDSFGNSLDSRTMNSRFDGKYAVWSVTGRVRVVFSELSPTTPLMFVAGLFIDPATASPCGMTSTPPVFTVHPQEVNACRDQPVTFTVQAVGENLSYQWRKDKVPIPGAITNTLSLASLNNSDRGTYDALVTGACGTEISLGAYLPIPFRLTVNPQPVNQTVNQGGSATFTATVVPDVLVIATPQWQVSRDQGVSWVDIPGGVTTLAGAKVTSTLTLSPVLPAQNGERYRVVFSHYCTTVTSDPVTLTVLGAGCPTQMIVNSMDDTSDVNPGNGLCADADGNCTLRTAIEEANALGPIACAPLTINLAGVSGSINLTRGLPYLTHPDLTLQGPGAAVLTVQRSTAPNTPGISLFITLTGSKVKMADFTIARAIGELGGAIYNNGTMVLDGVILKDNHPGIANGHNGMMTIKNSTISNGIASLGDIGDNLTNLGTLEMSNSLIANAAGYNPSFINYASANLVNVTVSNNNRAGIQSAGNLNLVHCTITGNAGGISRIGGLVTLQNTIVAGNTSDLSGTVLSNGYNLIGVANEFFQPVSTDLTGTAANPLNPQLAPLNNNGGLTQTHALLLGSPALDRGKSFDVATDQRGQPRPIDSPILPNASGGDGSDVGAFEAACAGPPQLGGFANASVPLNGSVAVGSSSGPIHPLVTFTVSSGSFTGDLSLLLFPRPTVRISNAKPAGTHTITVTATGNCGATLQKSFTLTVLSPPQINVPAISRPAGSNTASVTIASVSDVETPTGALTVAINDATNASLNGVTVSNLVNTNGTLTAQIATTCAATTAQFTLKVTDGDGQTATMPLTVTVTANAPPVLSYTPPSVAVATTPSFNPASGPSDNGTVNSIVLQSIMPNTGLALSVHNTTGAIMVTSALVPRAYTVVVRALDNCGVANDTTFTVNVVCPAVSLNPAALPNGVLGTAYGQTLTANPAGGNYSYTLTTGVLPPGLTLASNGSLSGTPTAAGNYTFAIKAAGWGACSGTQNYNLLIIGTCATVTVNPASLPSATVGAAYSQAVTANPAGTYTFAVTQGVLPPGLTLDANTGALSGTATTGGTFSFRIAATAQGGCIGSRTYVVTVSCGTLGFTPATLPNGTRGMVYSQQLSVSAGGSPANNPTFSLLLGSLPPGFTLSSVGLLSGMTNQTGTYNFTVKALAGTCQSTKAYSLVISGGTAALALSGDYDGDGKRDPTLWSASDGTWRIIKSSNGQAINQVWGAAGDVTLLGDYDGDGKTDLAVFRPSNGTFYIKRSSDGGFIVKPWGLSTDVPVPGDYDGDGKTDVAVWRGSIGIWYISRSSDGQYEATAWGSAAAPYHDVPVAGDYDGDGKSEVAVFQRLNGTWLIKRSRDGQSFVKQWGAGTDVPVAHDYDGDGRTDIAVWRGSSGTWYIWQSAANDYRVVQWGASGDQTAPGDYDGDGQADLAVWRSGEAHWYLVYSRDGSLRQQALGRSSDLTVPRQP